MLSRDSVASQRTKILLIAEAAFNCTTGFFYSTIQYLTLYGYIITAQQRTIIHQYGDWYTSLDGRAVTFDTVRRECGPAQSPHRCTKCNSPHINDQCINLVLFDVAL